MAKKTREAMYGQTDYWWKYLHCPFCEAPRLTGTKGGPARKFSQDHPETRGWQVRFIEDEGRFNKGSFGLDCNLYNIDIFCHTCFHSQPAETRNRPRYSRYSPRDSFLYIYGAHWLKRLDHETNLNNANSSTNENTMSKIIINKKTGIVAGITGATEAALGNYVEGTKIAGSLKTAKKVTELTVALTPGIPAEAAEGVVGIAAGMGMTTILKAVATEAPELLNKLPLVEAEFIAITCNRAQVGYGVEGGEAIINKALPLLQELTALGKAMAANALEA